MRIEERREEKKREERARAHPDDPFGSSSEPATGVDVDRSGSGSDDWMRSWRSGELGWLPVRVVVVRDGGGRDHDVGFSKMSEAEEV